MKNKLGTIKIFVMLYITCLKSEAREYSEHIIKRLIPWIYNRHHIFVRYWIRKRSIFDLEIYLIPTKNSDECLVLSSNNISFNIKKKLQLAEKILPLPDLPLDQMDPINAKLKAKKILGDLIVLSSLK